MSRIRIEDLPQEVTLGRQEMREVLGGSVPSGFTAFLYRLASWLVGESDFEQPTENAVAGVRG